MSVFLDSTYLNLLSTRFRNFKKKRDALWNFSCPFCGDSKKDKKKARGFVYKKGNQLFYKCYNCPASFNFPNFVKNLDSDLYDQYISERFRIGDDVNIKRAETERVMDFQKPVFKKRADVLEGLPTLSSLGDDHPAVKYLLGRKIPREVLRTLYWSEDYRQIAMRFDEKYENLREKDCRIVIPFIDQDDKVVAVQGRSIRPDEKIRYITVKASDDSAKVYGLNTVDRRKTIYVVEGAMDSFFLPNSIAAACSDLRIVGQFVPKDKCVLVPDREPRNKELCRQIRDFIKDGWKVALLPDDLESKDINDYILKDGKTQEEIVKIIDEHTYEGLSAEFEFSNWKKVGV